MYEITTYYEISVHLKQSIKIFKQYFKNEARYRRFVLRNIENLKIVTHLHNFIHDEVYINAISYLIKSTRTGHVISTDEEIFRSERESEWIRFLNQAKDFFKEQKDSISYLTHVSKNLVKTNGKKNLFPEKGEYRLMVLHHELRKLLLTKNDRLVFENTFNFIFKYYKDEMHYKNSGKSFTFPIGLHEAPIPSAR